MRYTLRPQQQEAVDFIVANSGGRTAITAPVAAGKTFIAKAAADNLKGRVAIISYSNDLVRQFSKTFPEIPVVIAAKHYPSKAVYEETLKRASASKIVLFNAASYVAYCKKFETLQFEHAVIDEIDANIGLIKLQTGKTIDCPCKTLSEADARALFADERHFVRNSQDYYWEVEEVFDKKTRDTKYVATLRKLRLDRAFMRKFFPPSVVGLSATIFESDLAEFDPEDWNRLELSSPIPPENRFVRSFTDEKYPEDIGGSASLLQAILKHYPERPALVHTTYAEAHYLAAITEGQLATYAKLDKLKTILGQRGQQSVVAGGGATIGLNLIDDLCRLNIILRGSFSNFVDSEFVRRRKSLYDGDNWYVEQVLKQAIQACGRSTRSDTDWSKIVIADNRLLRLLVENKRLLPAYFKEATDFL